MTTSMRSLVTPSRNGRLAALIMSLMFLALIETSAIANAATCAALPRPRMRLRLTVASTQFPEAEPLIRAIVGESWRRYGVTFDWADDLETSQSKMPTDAWIAAVHGMPLRFDGGDMGQVLFDHDVPSPLIRISIDAVTKWVVRQQATRLQTSTVFHSPMTMLVGDTATLVVRALGHIAAHELGHFMLGRAHAPSGLMAAHWVRDPVTTARFLKQESLPLDSISRAALKSRLEESASCPKIDQRQ
jgi:hypothetical protein